MGLVHTWRKRFRATSDRRVHRAHRGGGATLLALAAVFATAFDFARVPSVAGTCTRLGRNDHRPASSRPGSQSSPSTMACARWGAVTGTAFLNFVPVRHW